MRCGASQEVWRASCIGIREARSRILKQPLEGFLENAVCMQSDMISSPALATINVCFLRLSCHTNHANRIFVYSDSQLCDHVATPSPTRGGPRRRLLPPRPPPRLRPCMAIVESPRVRLPPTPWQTRNGLHGAGSTSGSGQAKRLVSSRARSTGRKLWSGWSGP